MEERRARPWPRPFTSALTKREAILVLGYLPVHVVVLQLILSALAAYERIDRAEANIIYYSLGFACMLIAAFGFLRRDFDPLADAPLRCLREVLGSYCLMICCNMAVTLLLSALLPESENPNNRAVLETAAQSGAVNAAFVFFAPVTEELLFRAGIFGCLRRRSRRAAYLVSALCFALYHVASFAAVDPIYWLYLLQYLPVSLLLARCYERTNSIWCSIFFHMLNNGVALSLLRALG